MKKGRWLLFVLIFFSVSCILFGTGEAGNVVDVSRDDPEMNAAIQEAQNTLDVFIAALQAPKPSQTHFSIKAGFHYGDQGGAEHIWLSDISYDGNLFKGTIGNDVYYVPNLKYGDPVTVLRDNISDWMIVENGKMIGGYTIRVLYCRMSPREQKQFLESIKMIIEETCGQNN